MSRSIQRSILKKQYEQFCEAWRNERMYQRIATESGKDLPEGQSMLGRKPTFKMWLEAKKNGAFAPKVEEKSVEVSDTSWEE